ncbi:CocE/NonD family hydrolase [Fibrella rubiginis]|nr:CocE/NonD family hydrolase [Fibrella rubiginis]
MNNLIYPKHRLCRRTSVSLGLVLLLLLIGATPGWATDEVRARYQKLEYRIPMRDGVTLYTAVYVPRDASSRHTYPFLMQRTCFGTNPYGPDQYPKTLGPSPTVQADGYIFVYQDVRGRWASGGRWTNMTPMQRTHHHAAQPRRTDESTDAHDTIDWLLRHVPYHNGRVGMWGVSYAGFYAIAGAINAHPALKAVSPQAPIADFFREDIHHNGAFTQVALLAYPLFGSGPPRPTTRPWFADALIPTDNQTEYAWHKHLGPLANARQYLARNPFWQQTVQHPNYDAFWQRRNILPHLRGVWPAVLVVGGWFDAENLYGTLQVHRTLRQHSPVARPMLVMGPFGHRGWTTEAGHTLHNDLYFGDSLATDYQRRLEAPFFRHHLKATGEALPPVSLFDTGLKRWQTPAQWPLPRRQSVRWYLSTTGKLTTRPQDQPGYRAYVSDPANPVPYTEASLTAEPDFSALFSYMSADQRFASTRPDVLTYQSEPLSQDLTVGGEITVRLQVSTNGTDADWIVKVIDVYPPDEPNHPYLPNPQTQLANYQQLVRADVLRSRYRRSYEKPLPLIPNRATALTLHLPDVLHTFRKGHRLTIQVQSSWFPLIDRNPQTFVRNNYKAREADFRSARHRVYSSSIIDVPVLP